jgi:hypothetical protein
MASSLPPDIYQSIADGQQLTENHCVHERGLFTGCQLADILSRCTTVTNRWPNCSALKDKEVMELTKLMGQPYMSRSVEIPSTK